MMKPDWSVERGELERVAQTYRQKGYDVTVEPAASETPDFVREYQPDIIARGSQESVVIEVKHMSSESDRERVRAIARRVESRPGWKFVLVAPERRDSIAGGPARIIDLSEIDMLLEEVDALNRNKSKHAALLVAWAAVEASMSFAADKEGIELRRLDSWTLMRELVSEGVLSRERYDHLTWLYKVRSAFAHGLRPVDEQAIDLDSAIDALTKTARELLADSGQ
jgi:hypothetical protein